MSEMQTILWQSTRPPPQTSLCVYSGRIVTGDTNPKKRADYYEFTDPGFVGDWVVAHKKYLDLYKSKDQHCKYEGLHVPGKSGEEVAIGWPAELVAG